MGRRRRSSSTTTTTTTSTSSMGGGGGMGGGGMGGACYVYPIRPAEVPALDPNPDVVFRRGIDMNIPMVMDDGRTVTMWGFPDLDAVGGGGMDGGGMGGGTFPSAPMRVRQGQVVQTELQVGMMMYHTIHHHGIEPEYRSDGVGHISWDVNGTYTYQWRPMHAGTYFYHCHTNTVLHAEMGMYGGIIVDPPSGPGAAFQNGPAYDLEAIWAVDEIDSSWHTLDWTAGACGGDVGLNRLRPDYFVISGVDGAQSALTHPAVAVTMSRGQRLLVRYICAGYLPQQIRFGGLTAQIVASDGRPLPRTISVTKIDAVSAERYDCIIQPTSRGTYTVEIDIKDWITGAVLGTARTRITVT
jgi:FtsP/CotA-like multicopper oxidase with cupredoxin domain